MWRIHILAVVVDGFNVYAGDAIDGRDRKRVERMCRYLARPPIATARLTETGDGDELRYELKKAWRDGTRFVRLDPLPMDRIRRGDDLLGVWGEPPS